MARDSSPARDKQELEGLLQSHAEDVGRDESPDTNGDILTQPHGSKTIEFSAAGDEQNNSGEEKRPARKPMTRRQSSFAQPRPDGTPRTPHRVRFDFQEPEVQGGQINGSAHPPRQTWLEEEDYMNGRASGDHDRDDEDRGPAGQRAPLLTGIEAPSVTLAQELDFNPEDLLESARPKSGLLSAFMNMANSIIGAGIIGQPYAFKQAGLLTGILLLITLTVTVDWTIRLIVTNSKLSGTDSFQATMEHCFGKSGLVAISVAQWAFAFGGMVAFCIIIGDTIPHVLLALFPSLPTMPVLWLLTDRRAIIVLFVLAFSYPLSLYRDIAMVCRPIFINAGPSKDLADPACNSSSRKQALLLLSP
nr:vacuolar amino acid transporter 2 [Quercus suber]